MPLYTYFHEIEFVDRGGEILKTTLHEMELLRKIPERDEPAICPECGVPMTRALSKVALPTVLERVDVLRNVKQRQNNTDRVRKRAKEFFVENEMPDLVAKAGEEQAKRFGWIKPDGKLVSKEDLK